MNAATLAFAVGGMERHGSGAGVGQGVGDMVGETVGFWVVGPAVGVRVGIGVVGLPDGLRVDGETDVGFCVGLDDGARVLGVPVGFVVMLVATDAITSQQKNQRIRFYLHLHTCIF